MFGPGSTRRAEKPSPRIACTAVTAPSVRSRVFVFACPCASMAQTWLPSSMLQACYMLVHLSHLIRNLVQLLVPSIEKDVYSFLLFIEPFFKQSIHIRQRGFTRPEFFLLGDGAIALRDSLALLPWHFRETSVLRTQVY